MELRFMLGSILFLILSVKHNFSHLKLKWERRSFFKFNKKFSKSNNFPGLYSHLRCTSIPVSVPCNNCVYKVTYTFTYISCIIYGLKKGQTFAFCVFDPDQTWLSSTDGQTHVANAAAVALKLINIWRSFIFTRILEIKPFDSEAAIPDF